MMELLVLAKILVLLAILQILLQINAFINVLQDITSALKIEILIHNVYLFVLLVLGNMMMYSNV